MWQGENVGTYTLPNLKRYAIHLKLDTVRFNTCLDNGEAKATVDLDIAQARQLRVNGTPAFFLNGQAFFPRALDFAEFDQAMKGK